MDDDNSVAADVLFCYILAFTCIFIWLLIVYKFSFKRLQSLFVFIKVDMCTLTSFVTILATSSETNIKKAIYWELLIWLEVAIPVWFGNAILLP